MKLTKKLSITFIFLTSVISIFAQNCPNLGPNINLPCGITSTVLTANLTLCNPTTITPNQTNTYSVSTIPFAPYPNAGTAVALTDDSQTGALPIGFTFCFFGNTYTQFYIGSNGWISFTAGQPVTFASNSIPSAAAGTPKNCIMGPWQDWHPGVGGTIRYQTQGTAPCRRLVVTWSNMPMYSCTNLQGTFQIVIFEGTNLIENHITNKPNCPAWSGGTGVQGIHNLPGTIGITVPGRNSTQWTTNNDARRWSPSGPTVNPTLTWFAVGNPIPIGTGPSITVTPPAGGQLYTCHFVYPACYVGFDGCIPSFGNSPDTILVVPGLTGITPTITAPVCINGPTQISVAPNSATNNVQWSGPTIVGSSTSPTVTVNAAGIYSVIISNAVNTCTGTATVSVQQTPTVIINNNGPVCTGTVLNLTGGGGATYAWTGPNGFNSAAQSPVINPVTVAASGNYSLLVTSGSCTNVATTNVVVNPLPTPIANNNSPVCLNQPINFTGSGASTYTWTGPGSYSSTNQNPVIASAQASNAGVYTLSVTSAAGCKNSVTTNVVINPLPVIITNSPTACIGTNINLTASGGNSYLWSGPLGFISLLQNPTIPNATSGMGGIYTVIVTSAAGCTASATSSVTVVALPVPVLNSNSPVCIGNALTFTASGGIINLTGPNGFNSAATNPTITNVTAAANGIYTLAVTAGSCSASTTLSVTINPLPNPVANSNSPVCVNQPINFTGSGASTYTWTGPGSYSSTAQNPVIASAQASNAGVYTLSVTNVNGCKNSVTTNVIINTLPVILTNSPTTCLNTNINLTASGGTGYAWSGPLGFTSLLQNPTIANATIPMTGIYTVTVTSASGCTASATSSVTVVNLPVAVLNSNSPVCIGGTLTFTASGGTINLTGPNGFGSFATNPSITNVTAAAGGIYTLIVSAGSCTASTTSSVTINPLPVPLANSNSPVCIGQPIIFTGNGGTAYSWSGPGGYSTTAQNPTIAVASSTNAGNYVLTVTNANGCTNTVTTNVIINPLPFIPALNNPTVCLNTNINLTASGGVGYAWSGPLGFSSLAQLPVIANATMPMSGQYTVIVTSAFGCTNSAISTVTVLPLPVPVIVSNTPCVGSNLNLLGNGGAVYAWIGPNGFNSAAQNPSINNVTLPANGIYTLITTVGSCSASTTQSVTVNALPVPIAGNNTPVCETKALILSGSGGNNYSWTGPLGFTSSSQNPTLTVVASQHSGNYILTVTNANGCQASATTAVNVLPNPSALANGATVCFGQPAIITATGGVTYSWVGPGNFSSNAANPTIPIVNNTTIGNYTVTVTAANGCTSTTAANVIANPLPVPSITSTPKTCLNTQINLQGSPGFLVYQWTGPDNFLSIQPSVSFTATSMTQSGTYSLGVIDNNGCMGITTTVVVLDAYPVAELVSENNKHCVPFCTNFTLKTAAGSASLISSSWTINGQNFSGSTLNYCITQAGRYPVKASFVDANGCPNSTTYTFTGYPVPAANFEFSPLNPIENIDDVLFDDGTKGDSIVAWHWHFINNNGYQTTVQNPSYFFSEPGTYPVVLVVKNKWGCADTVVKPVFVGEDFSFFVPNAFTPNGDGINDTFYPKGHGILKYNMMIFDRWGEKLFVTDDFFAAWDGTFKGGECTSDVYVWKINVTLPNSKVKTYTGHVTLNR